MYCDLILWNAIIWLEIQFLCRSSHIKNLQRDVQPGPHPPWYRWMPWSLQGRWISSQPASSEHTIVYTCTDQRGTFHIFNVSWTSNIHFLLSYWIILGYISAEDYSFVAKKLWFTFTFTCSIYIYPGAPTHDLPWRFSSAPMRLSSAASASWNRTIMVHIY